MAEENKSPSIKSAATTQKPVLRKILTIGFILFFAAAVFYFGFLVYNNVSVHNEASFAKRLDKAIANGDIWIQTHRLDIMEGRNLTLLRMLKECDELKANPVFGNMIRSYLVSSASAKISRGTPWLLQIDPNWPITERELNELIKKSDIDYKWIIYALAPDKADITPEQMYMFDRWRWSRRKLTHQLYALTLLRQTKGADDKLNELIEHLCNRLARQLVFDAAVVDIYIQKVAFILMAGHPEKVRVQWIEKIIANQQPDGGWNDRWYCFSSSRIPIFNFATPPSDQHPTIQAMAALYLVKYRYPEQFGLKKDSSADK